MTITPLTITPLYAGLLAIWFLVLSYRVVQQRGHGVSLGHGNDEVLLRRMRGHANFAEYVPLLLILIGMLELGGLKPWAIHALGATLLVSRLLHGAAFAFTGGWKFGRFWGTALTFALLATAGGLAIWRALG